jgi:nucleoid-associated protein YgaU
MISNNSRYVNSKLVTQTKDDGTQVVVITPSDAASYTFTYTYYAVTGSDRIDTIANAFYGDPTKWWKIGDANPEIMKWDNIPPGTVLRIPNA